MRLPGTLNIPTAKKRAKGRTERAAEIIELNDAVYDLSEFTPAAVRAQEDSGFSAGAVTISSNVQRLNSLQELPVKDLCKRVISNGNDPDDPLRWSSRSEPLFWAVCEMVRAGVSDDTIYAVITDPDWKISESVLEQGSRAHKYAIRQIERANEEEIDPNLR